MNEKLSVALGEPAFETPYRVIYADTDAARVVYNANYLRYFEIGRTEMVRAWGIPYSYIETLGCFLPVTETYLRFKAPARYDDLLTISTSLVELKKVSCRFHYAITRQNEKGKQTLLVRGSTTHACVGASGTLVAFPQEVLDKMALFVATKKA
ncbi:MAG: thioesterase [Desulfobulbus propionicus]|nr:MAG: thioesterase [Desulfobulbus propionicus]